MSIREKQRQLREAEKLANEAAEKTVDNLNQQQQAQENEVVTNLTPETVAASIATSEAPAVAAHVTKGTEDDFSIDFNALAEAAANEGTPTMVWRNERPHIDTSTRPTHKEDGEVYDAYLDDPFAPIKRTVNLQNRIDRGDFHIAVITGQRQYREFAVINAILDRINPELVIIGDAGNPDRIAMAWAKSVGADYLPIYPEWEKLGNQAGPLRNQRVMKELREMMRELNKSAVHLVFESDQYPFDRAVNSMVTTANAMNDQLNRRPMTLRYVVPILNAEHWMQRDLDAAAAKSLLVPGLESDFPDAVMVGAQRVQPRNGNITTTTYN